MIFLTVGTQKFPFDRLVKEIDGLVKKDVIKEEIFGQIGGSQYLPQTFQCVDFMREDEFDYKLSHCRILITHGGVGTIIKGLSLKKKVIVIPRLKIYGEHIDDHQLEIAECFSKLNYCVMCNEMDQLGNCILQVDKKKFCPYEFAYGNIPCFLKKSVETLEGK